LPATIGTPAELDRILRKNFSDCGIRIAPDTRMTDVLEAFKAIGVAVVVEDGFLVLSQGGTVFHTAQALKGFATKAENANFFVLQTGDPKSWTREQKVAYLRTHNDSDYRRLIQQGPISPNIGALDANMSKSDYLKLTRQEKLAFISEFKDDAVRQIMGKKL
jgi:hypothetical protein